MRGPNHGAGLFRGPDLCEAQPMRGPNLCATQTFTRSGPMRGPVLCAARTIARSGPLACARPGPLRGPNRCAARTIARSRPFRGPKVKKKLSGEESDKTELRNLHRTYFFVISIRPTVFIIIFASFSLSHHRQSC